MRLLFLAHRVPDRPTKGDKIRAWHELRALAARHEVHFFGVDDRGDAADAGDAARPDWAGEVASTQVFRLEPMAARLRAARALVVGGALTAAHFALPALRGAVKAALAERRFDLAFVYSGAVEPLVGGFSPRVVDLVDVDSEKFRLYHELRAVPAIKRLACAIEWRRLRALEKRASESAEATLVCTEGEALTLRSFARPRRLEVVGNGVDLDAFPFAPPAGRAQDEILFVGALDYRANVDACERLVRDLLPRIRREFPAASVTLVGSRPDSAVRALAREPGVSLHADVESVLPFVRRATLTLLPLRVARGVQNKALEALASGLPLVVSGEVARGLSGIDGRDWLAGAGPEELAKAAVRLLGDAALREQLARAGRALVESSYDWRRRLDRLLEVVEESANALRERPIAKVGTAP